MAFKNIKYLLVSTLIQVLIIVYFIADPTNKLIPVWMLALNIVFLVKLRKQLALFFMFLFFTLYTYACIKVFYQGYSISAYFNFGDARSLNFVLLSNSLFIYTVGNVINRKYFYIPLFLDRESFKSKYLFWILVVIGSLMIQFGIRGASVLTSGGYNAGSSKSTLHEYFILVFLILALVRPRGVVPRIVLTLMFLIFCAKTILYGGRIEVMEIGSLALVIFLLLPKKENKTLLFTFAIIAFYISNVISAMRNNPLPLLNGEVAIYLNPVKVSMKKNQKIRPPLNDNQGDVIQSSARLNALIEDGVLDEGTRIKSFVFMLISVGVPYSMLPDYANLAAYHQSYEYRSGGGGLLGSFFYAWLGFAGPVVIGLFIGYFLNKGLNPHSRIPYKIYAVMLLAMYPRWYAYAPIIAFKFCFLTAVMYVFASYAYRIFFLKTDQNPGMKPMET